MQYNNYIAQLSTLQGISSIERDKCASSSGFSVALMTIIIYSLNSLSVYH